MTPLISSLPAELLRKCLVPLDWNDAARASCVCTLWKQLVSIATGAEEVANCRWHSTAETPPLSQRATSITVHCEACRLASCSCSRAGIRRSGLTSTTERFPRHKWYSAI